MYPEGDVLPALDTKQTAGASMECPLSGGKPEKHSFTLSLTAFDPSGDFGSIPRTCLSASVTDRAMEAWYHPFIA